MKRWRYTIAALAGIGLLSGCQERQEPTPQPSVAASEAGITPKPPFIEPPINREILLWDIMREASNTALGTSATPDQPNLDGKPFELRLRFGCPGDETPDTGRSWTFDKDRRKLQLRVIADVTGDSAFVSSLVSDDFEAVEGFVIRRPWVLSAGCPAAIATAPEAASSQDASDAKAAPSSNPPGRAVPTIAIAQFFTDTDARTHRRNNRGYSATKVLEAGVEPSSVGYNLVINGRLRRSPGGKVITCRTLVAASPPDCIVSAQFDSVAIENPGTGEKLAKWSGA